METKPTNAFNVFFSYDHEDKALLDKLDAQLSPLKHEGLIRSWSDLSIDAGNMASNELLIKCSTVGRRADP